MKYGRLRVVAGEYGRAPLYPDDSLADFKARMHVAKHKLIVEAVR